MAKLPSEIAGAALPKKPKQQAAKYPEFAVPASFQPPANIQPNEDFRALGTFRIKGDGTMCITAVDGSPVVADKEEQSESY